jgi:hypothetical protein
MAGPSQPNKYLDLVESFVDNVRVLIRGLGEHEGAS